MDRSSNLLNVTELLNDKKENNNNSPNCVCNNHSTLKITP